MWQLWGHLWLQFTACCFHKYKDPIEIEGKQKPFSELPSSYSKLFFILYNYIILPFPFFPPNPPKYPLLLYLKLNVYVHIFTNSQKSLLKEWVFIMYLLFSYTVFFLQQSLHRKIYCLFQSMHFLFIKKIIFKENKKLSNQSFKQRIYLVLKDKI